VSRPQALNFVGMAVRDITQMETIALPRAQQCGESPIATSLLGHSCSSAVAPSGPP
jgi:hypothetical protein